MNFGRSRRTTPWPISAPTCAIRRPRTGLRCIGVDPFGLFQPTLATPENEVAGGARYHRFPVYFGGKIEPPKGRVDRIPFSWDFGFLGLQRTFLGLGGRWTPMSIAVGATYVK